MRFCGSCGSELEAQCPHCGFNNPPTFSYCGGCGEPLSTSHPDLSEDIGLIERHLPSGLRERVLAGKHMVEGERRRVTVLFCDMAGFTSITDHIGPEAAYSLMDRIYGILMNKVYEFGGTVNELTGDGILALFGAPVALEDAPQRAIRSALAIHEGIAQFNDEMQIEHRGFPQVSMRVGINTGPVVVGTLGNDLRVEFKAVGDTVNLASRLEQMAEPGTVLVTEEIFKLTEGLFRFEGLGGQLVDGKEGPIPVYRVIAPGTSRTRFDVSTERGLTPFVGRERELEILFDAYRRAKEGRGQAVSISAEAGLGKSRLLYEFRKAISSESVAFLEGRCLSYGRGLPYHPVIDLFRSSFDLVEGDAEEVVKSKLGPALRHLNLDGSTASPLLMDLLTGTSRRTKGPSLTPEARKALVIRALTEFLISASEERPVVVAVEDLHWIDSNSEEIVNHLLESISASRILMLLTHRPEYPRTWRQRSYHSELTLNRLSVRETLTMARHQLGVGEMDEAVEELILEKTEGVPFFVEEFINSLRDLGILDMTEGICRLTRGSRDVVIPTTIQDVLRSRADKLPDSARQLLSTASVIGREVPHEMLRETTGVAEEDLLSDLSILKDSEIFYERGIYPRSTYLFKHALTREVVYDSLLRDQRRELHRRAGEAIEAIHDPNLTEHYGVLAEHFAAGDVLEKAAEYSRLAAKRAHQVGAFPTAIDYARKNVRCISRLPRTDEAFSKEVDARVTLAGFILMLGRPHEAEAAIAPIVGAAASLEGHTNQLAIHTAVGLHELFTTENYDSAMRHLEKALAAPLDHGSAPWHWFAGYYLSGFLSWTCRFEDAIRHLERVKELSEAAGRVEGVAVARSSIALARCWQGDLAGASDEIYQALGDAATSHNPTSQALTQAALGIIRASQGLHSEARTHLLEGVRFTGETAQSFWRSIDLAYLGDTLYSLGEIDVASARFEESLKALEQLVPSWRAVLRLKLARARALNGVRDVRTDELHALRDENSFCLFEGLTARLISQILLTLDPAVTEEPARWVEIAIEADLANGLSLELAHDYACSAEIHRIDERREEMLADLHRARDLFETCAADGYVAEMNRLIASSDPT